MRFLVVYSVFALILASCATHSKTLQPPPQPVQHTTSLTTASFPESDLADEVAPMAEEHTEEAAVPISEERETTLLNGESMLPESELQQMRNGVSVADPLVQRLPIVLEAHEEEQITESNDRRDYPEAEEDSAAVAEILLWGDPHKKRSSLVLEEDGSLKFDFGKETRWSADIGYDHGPEAWLLYTIEWDFAKPRRR